jgi:hypothetical protein
MLPDVCIHLYIQSISTPPNMEEAESMQQILDANRDKRVTEADFESLALRYLCNQSNINSRY